VWTLLDTMLRLGELAQLKNTNVDQELHRITVYGKGGPYGSMSPRRVLQQHASGRRRDDGGCRKGNGWGFGG